MGAAAKQRLTERSPRKGMRIPSLLGRAREGLLLLVFEVEHWIAIDNLAG